MFLIIIFYMHKYRAVPLVNEWINGSSSPLYVHAAWGGHAPVMALLVEVGADYSVLI